MGDLSTGGVLVIKYWENKGFFIIFAKGIVRSCKPNGQGEITRAPPPLFYNGEGNLNASKIWAEKKD